MTNGVRSNGSEIAVYLELGSNLGNREANLREAIARIEALGLEIVRESSVYETEPVGFRDQPWFLNQVIETKFLAAPAPAPPSANADDLRAEALLSGILNIEHEMGRERAIPNGPRVIDIDLLLFGDKTMTNSPELERESKHRTGVVVPHPRMHLRRFVLEPLCEIAPELVHPLLKKTCREILAEIEDSSEARIYASKKW